MATNSNPQDRRRGFVNRLYQQYQQGSAAGKAAPGMGTPFHAGIRSAPAIHTQMTNFDNIGQGVRNALGVGGMGSHLPTDAGIPGQEVASAATAGTPLPRPISLPLPGAGNGSPLPPSTPSAPATTSGNLTGVDPTSPAGQQQAQGILPAQGTPSGTVNGYATSTTAGGDANVDPGFNSIPHDAVPLGGGIYWSPTSGILNLGSSGVNIGTLSPITGSAARTLGMNTPV